MMAFGTSQRPIANHAAACLLLTLGVSAAQLWGAGLAAAQEFRIPANARTIILDETNAYREEHGLPPLRLSKAASKVARDYAKYLAETDKVGHRADGRSARDRLRAQGIEVCHVWENWHKSWLDQGQRQTIEEATEKAMNFWKRSPGHARNMRANARYIGIGIVGWKHKRRWVYTEVQVFLDRRCLKGRKKESPFPARVLP